MSKIVAVSSVGGHWVQLLRLRPLFDKHQTMYVTTRPEFESMVGGEKFDSIPDFNRSNMHNVLYAIVKLFKIIRREKPEIVFTTGAAPGLIALVIAKFLGAKTIWLDSIANVEELSMSGKIASKFCSRVYTQWPDLAKGRVVYAGNILS